MIKEIHCMNKIKMKSLSAQVYVKKPKYFQMILFHFKELKA